MTSARCPGFCVFYTAKTEQERRTSLFLSAYDEIRNADVSERR